MTEPSRGTNLIVYPPGRSITLAMGVGAIAVAILGLATTGQVTVATGVLGLLGALTLSSGLTIRIVVSPSGIEYHQLGYSFQAPWVNTAKIIPATAGAVQVEALLIPGITVRGSTLLANLNGMRPRGAVPLSRFGRDWRTRPLGDAIRQYAPYLFDAA
jgi:hypothetical protein